MLGHPKYKIGDPVTFEYTFEGETRTAAGEVYIVDRYGTFEQDEEVSYDIMAPHPLREEEMCLFKHIRESRVGQVKRNADE